MSEFVASNGIIVVEEPDGEVYIRDDRDRSGADHAQALREFFQAEADERLGRWRWPENTDYVVYHSLASGDVRVVDELTGYFTTHTASSSESFVDYGGAARVAANAARAFFDAHPDPKPEWHDAEPGQMWLLTIADESSVPAVTSSSESGYTIFTAATGEAGGTEELFTSSIYITAGRRVWPEVLS